MATDSPKQTQDHDAGANAQPANQQSSGPTPQQQAAIEALTGILVELRKQVVAEPAPELGEAARKAVEQFIVIKESLVGPNPEWVLPTPNPKMTS